MARKNDIEIYWKHSEGKSVVAERFIITLNNKFHKCMTSVSKSVFINKLYVIINKFDNTLHSTIKMKLVYVKSNTYINSSKEINDKNPKFKIGDIVTISKHKNISWKGYVKNWSEEAFVIKKVENIVPWTYVISDLAGNCWNVLRKRIAKTNEKASRVGKVIKRKGDKLYVNCKDTIIHLIAG